MAISSARARTVRPSSCVSIRQCRPLTCLTRLTTVARIVVPNVFRFVRPTERWRGQLLTRNVGSAASSRRSPRFTALMVLTAAVATAALAANYHPAASAGEALEPAEMTLWHNYGIEANAKATDALIAAYEAKNPGVTIEAVSPAGRQVLRVCSRRPRSRRRGRTSLTQWTGLFDAQEPGLPRAAQRLRPDRRAQEVRRASTSRAQGPQGRRRRLCRAARPAVLQRLLQQGPVRQGRRRVVPDDVG